MGEIINQNELLKFCIENPNLIRTTQPEIFYGEYKQIFEVLRRMDQRGIKPSYLALRKWFESKALLTELEALPWIEGAQDIDLSTFRLFKDDLLKLAKTRLINQYNELQEINDKDWKEFTKRLYALNQTDEPEVFKAGSFLDFKTHIEAEGITVGSGLYFLENTGSDFQLAQLITFIAPSGHGKSQLLAHIVKHLFMTRRKVLTIVFEETEAQYKSRIGQGLLVKTRYQYKQLNERDLEREFQPKINSMGQLDVISGTSVAVEDLEDLIQKQEEEKGYRYDAIVIDYSKQLILKDGKNKQEWQMIGDVFRKLKEICMRKGNERLIVTAIQSNRDGYNLKKSLGEVNIADSMGPLHNVDMMIGIHRKNINEPGQVIDEKDQDPKGISNILKLNILKKRLGTINQGDTFYYNLLNCNNIEAINDPVTIERLNANFDSLLEDSE